MTGRVSEIVSEHRHLEVTTDAGEIFKIDIRSIDMAWAGLKIGDRVSFDPARLALNVRRQ